MKDYRFTLAATAGSSESMQATAGFFRYFKESSGAVNTRITIRANNGNTFVLEPGDWVRMSDNCSSFDVINTLGGNTIDGILLHGDKGESSSSSNLQIGGSIGTTETRASAAAVTANATVGTAAAQVYAAAAGQRRVRLYSPKTNTDTIWLGHSNAVTSALAIEGMEPGEAFVLDLEASLSLFAIAGAAGQKLNFTLYT